MSAQRQDRITYAFEHMVASFNPEDPHHGDSGELAGDILTHLLGMDEAALMVIGALGIIAEHVASNYAYTGEADEFLRRVRAGEA